MQSNRIIVKGAREHNLRNVTLELPKRQLVVFTGPSGSGKSSLAFDTLFAEGQRRYVESLSVYARQFLGQLEKPDYDELLGLSPTVSIEQKSVSHNPRSTVGTITEVYDYLRLLYARVGTPRCPVCAREVGRVSAERIADELAALPDRQRYQLMAPLVRNRKGEFKDLFERLRRSGYVRARVDGEIVEIDGIDRLKKTVRHTIDVVVDRLVARGEVTSRLRDSLSAALALSGGDVTVLFDGGELDGTERAFSTRAACPEHDVAIPELTPQTFSFNSPLGRCDSCEGLGTSLAMDPERVVPDPSQSINKKCFKPIQGRNRVEKTFLRVQHAWCDVHGIPRGSAWEELSDDQRHAVLYGADEVERLMLKGRKTPVRTRYEGVLPFLERRLREAETENQREGLLKYTAATPCAACGGSRLRPESRAVTVAGVALPEVVTRSVAENIEHFDGVTLHGTDATIGGEVLHEIRSRLRFLDDVGLGYLSLGRGGPTLSGGEAQRIRLASQLGSELTGVLYVLDEPSIGLHQRDNKRLLDTLGALRDRGNSVVVVEHDRETMECADLVVDFGPGAGTHGGEVTFVGPPDELRAAEGNVTGDYLAGRRNIEPPSQRRKGNGQAIVVRGARGNNLRDVDVRFPLGTFTCVTGVSGAGKSTLVNETLYAAAANHHYEEIRDVAVHRRIEGLDHIDKVIRIDQQPIGRTPRSNPATYTKLFDDVRSLFAQLPESQMYGYAPGRFSFNVAGGRCETCQGAGVVRIEMTFMSDVYVECDVCRGRRFNDATLRVRYRGHDIAQVLDMPFDDALELFEAHPRLNRRIQTLVDVGLGYMKLGQPSPTLSGGEAQRVKLSRELGKVATGMTLYVLDEPSTGLHFDDVRKLLDVVHALVDAGNTVVMIEHNLDIIKVADHVIDMGPEGGAEGGFVVVEGTPEQVAACEASHTGRFLREELGR